MKWVGMLLLLFIFICCCTAAVTCRIRWLLSCIWCIPIFAMTLCLNEPVKINELVVFICIFMCFATQKGLWNVRMWNIKIRKSFLPLYIIYYLLSAFLFYYCMTKSTEMGYFGNFRLADEQNGKAAFWVVLFLFSLLLFPMARNLFDFTDRLFCKKSELVLIQCRYSIFDIWGGDGNIGKQYYLHGISNGVDYHFKMTVRNYYMLKNETALKLKVCRGILGGLYISENPCPQNERKLLRRDRKTLKLWTLIFFVFAAVGVWIFWFRK